jgi:hypothetical protein
MGKVIRFPSYEERLIRDQARREAMPAAARTHSGRVLEGKLLGMPGAGRRQKPRFTTPSRDES